MKVRFLICLVVGLCCQAMAKSPSGYVTVVKKAAPAVVNISADQIVEKSPLAELFGNPFFGFGDWERGVIEKSLGSGVIVDGEGIVVTCHHVVRNARVIRVKMQDNTEYNAKVVTVDEKNDIAALRLEGKPPAGGFPVMGLGNSDTVEEGEEVLAIGNAFGLGKLVSRGIVSNRSLRVMGRRLLGTDTAINPGNSGGALVNMEGLLIAMPNAILSKTGAFNGVGFGIPVKLIQAVIESSKQGKPYVMRPWIGVNVQDIEAAIAESLGMHEQTGVIVQSVHPLSPAKDKLDRNDIILQFNGDNLLDREDFHFRLQTLSVADIVKLKVRKKDGSQQDISLTLIMPPEKPAANETILQGNHPLKDVTVANLSPATAVQLGIDANQQEGVVVMKTNSSPVVRYLGIQEGDIILALNGQPIEDVKDLQNLLGRSRQFALTLKRQHQVITLEIR